MSTLWTPGGEVPVGGRGAAATGEPVSQDPVDQDPGAAVPEDIDLDNLSPEEREQAEAYIRDLAESRERIKAVPASVVIANHAMGLYELAALHLSSQPPNFPQATISIDALGALLDGLQGRLGEPEPTLRESLSQLRMAFVQLKNRHDQPADPAEASDDANGDEPGDASSGASPEA